MVTLVWISMFHGACQLMNLARTQCGLNMKNFSSPKQIKCEQGLTCLQAFASVIDKWMSSTMQYKLKCVLLNTHKKLQTSCIVTFFVFSWKMKNLCLKPSMTVVLILTSSLQTKSGSLQRKWRPQKQLCSISSKLQVTPSSSNQFGETPVNRLPTKQTQEKSFESRPPSHKWHTSEQQVPPYKRRFDPKQAHTSKDRCSKCGDSRHVEGFKCPAKKYQCKSCHKYGHFTSLYFKKQVPLSQKTQSTPNTS